MAALLLLAAVLSQWTLRPWLGSRLPFLFLLPAVGIAAMFGGWRPALLVLAGGAANGWFWLDASGPPLTVAMAGYLAAGGLLAALGGRVSELRARASLAEDRLGEQVQDLQALHELSSRIALLPALGGQLQAVLETLCELQGAGQGMVALRGPDGRALDVVAQIGFSEPALEQLGALADGESAGQAMVVVRDTEEDPRYAPLRELARREGFRAVHSRPLVDSAGQVLGVIAIHFAQPRELGERDERLGDLCARMAAVLAERDAALRQAGAVSRRLEVALDSSAVPFCLVQPVRAEDGTVRTFRWAYLNAAAATLMGRSPSELAGRPVREAMTSGSLDPELLGRAVDALQSGRTVQFESWAEMGTRRRWFHVIASPHDGGLAIWFADVTARKRQEEALREADRRKDEFLATLAHELRNPLAPIRQAALIAKAPAATEAQKRWSTEVIERQVAHMAVLLDDLLDVSRITRGKLELRREVVPVVRVIESALEAARPLAEARHQALEVQLPSQPVWVDADALRLAQVLSNLLANASKFTPEHGRLALSARAEGGWVRIAVSDNGIGIAADALEDIFEMFTQVRSKEGGAAGLGIGLALSRGLVELHGGRLTATSAGEGRGSTFTVQLPLAQQPVAAAQPEPSHAAQGRIRRVLVADDNRDAAQSLADLLRMEGHEVAVAFDGEDALTQFGQFAPEVALLDIGMPKLTGNQVASAIRSRPEGAGTLLVAITGWGQERDRNEAREAGFDLHFTKPVDPDQVLRLLDTPPAR